MHIFVVDAFTDRPFAGNPAGVCLLDQDASDEWRSSVAREMKHSETAFVEAVEGDEADFRLRWFTPAGEVDLCGHATLATAHVLFGRGARGPLRFATRSGVLTVRGQTDGSIVMDFPSLPASEADVPGVAEALGVEASWIGRSRFDVLVEVAEADTVRDAVPDIAALGRVDARGFILTARADGSSDADFVSRFFAPREGVPEDPVTGSAHCVLAPYWAHALARSDGDTMTGVQLSRRGGTVQVSVNGGRVSLAGRAVTVLDGALSAGV